MVFSRKEKACSIFQELIKAPLPAKMKNNEMGVIWDDLKREKVFDAFGKVPDMLWEDEYQKYMDVLDKYKDIKVTRWSQN